MWLKRAEEKTVTHCRKGNYEFRYILELSKMAMKMIAKAIHLEFGKPMTFVSSSPPPPFYCLFTHNLCFILL